MNGAQENAGVQHRQSEIIEALEWSLLWIACFRMLSGARDFLGPKAYDATTAALAKAELALLQAKADRE